MNRAAALTTLLLVALITALVSSRLRMSVNPGFMFQEQYGLGYNFAPHLGALCDPNPLTGLSGPTSNVTDQRSLSLLYVAPTKLLRHTIDPYVLHRFLGITFFSLTLFGLWGLARTLGFSLLPTTLLIVTVGLSTQLISYLYESKLTITSAAWFSLTVWCVAAFDRSLRERLLRRAGWLVFILPLLLASAYETYVVSRPLAVVFLGLIGVYLLGSSVVRGHRLSLGAIYLSAVILGGTLLKLLHPHMRFDQTLFEGRTESLVTPSGTLFAEWRETVVARLTEIPALFRWSPSYFSSETLNEAGSLELWLTLACAAFVTLLAMSGPAGSRTRALIDEHRRFYLMLFLICGTAAIVPLLSVTYVRGHRLFGLYIGGAIFLGGLAHSLLQDERPALRTAVSLIVSLLISALALYRIPLVLGWHPPAHFTPPYAHQTLAELETLPLPEGIEPIPNTVLVRVCDQTTPPAWEHFWNAALYVSDYGCKVGGATTRLGCECDSREMTEGLRGIVCLTRTANDGGISLHSRYIALPPSTPNG
jgi:hypothetical protein